METQAETSSTLRRLPDHWVAKIFREMQGNYGSRFLNQWKTGQSLPDGQDAGVRNAMSVWAEKLGGFLDTPEVFASVLASLPDEPPSLPAFVALCRAAMLRARDGQQKLEHHMTAEERARAEEAAAVALKAMKQMTEKDPLLWAKFPRSKIAFAEVLKLAKSDQRFVEIMAKLTEQGVTDGHTLLKSWNGKDWVSA